MGDYNTQDVKGAPRKTARLFTTLYNNSSFRVSPCFQPGLVQRIQHLGVFTVHCFETHSTGKTLHILN